MIISKTPLRISFVGGGTDIKDFFQHEFGCVVNAAINKYIYICIHKHFDGSSFLLKYSRTEKGSDVNKIKHPLFREAMKLTDVTGVEITSMSDVPATGVGLGSSSSFLVGLLNALYAYKDIQKSLDELAKEAYFIEREILKEKGGYQDQYIAALGGLQYMQFNPDNSILVEPITCSEETKKELDRGLLIFYTGITRDSGEIHEQQQKQIKKNLENLKKMKQLTIRMRNELQEEKLHSFGEMLHENWLLKKQLAEGITDPELDSLYQKAVNSGALGGKLCGAGGGGFLLFYCEPENQRKVRHALANLKELDFQFEPKGSQIIYDF